MQVVSDLQGAGHAAATPDEPVDLHPDALVVEVHLENVLEGEKLDKLFLLALRDGDVKLGEEGSVLFAGHGDLTGVQPATDEVGDLKAVALFEELGKDGKRKANISNAKHLLA